MSIVTLKRKTQVQYNNMSVNSKTGFSLNGTHRSQGYIGQTMLSRSLPRTPMKGNVAKGHGGCCGKYPKYGIIQSAVTSLNDTSIVKSSVQTTYGMLRTHYKWIWRPQPYSTTKVDTFHNSNPQSNYISKLSSNTANIVDSCNRLSKPITFNKICIQLPREARPKQHISAQLVQTRKVCNIVKMNITRPEKNNALLGISSSSKVNPSYTSQQYINKLNAHCNEMNEEVINTKLNKGPLIGGSKSF